MKKQRTIILFLVRFFVSYFLLFLLYSLYLQKNQSKENEFVCAPITIQVADHTSNVLTWFGVSNSYEQHDKELSVKLTVENQYTSRVIEGCNSVSIIILFLAFVIGFSGPLKATVFFGMIGSSLIYIVNVFRIAFLTYMLYKYPDHQMVLHNLVFPAIIYGFTFLLWILWVQKFSYHKL